MSERACSLRKSRFWGGSQPQGARWDVRGDAFPPSAQAQPGDELEPLTRFELVTFPLPRGCSTPELQRRHTGRKMVGRVGFEPT